MMSRRVKKLLSLLMSRMTSRVGEWQLKEQCKRFHLLHYALDCQLHVGNCERLALPCLRAPPNSTTGASISQQVGHHPMTNHHYALTKRIDLFDSKVTLKIALPVATYTKAADIPAAQLEVFLDQHEILSFLHLLPFPVPQHRPCFPTQVKSGQLVLPACWSVRWHIVPFSRGLAWIQGRAAI
jgi:hypothetical protein